MINDVISEILDRGKDDWLDFAEVVSLVQSRSHLEAPAVIEQSVELIGDMLNRQLVRVGDLQKRGDKILFAPWVGPPKQIIERIKSDLTSLGQRPGIGDVCWLSTA